MRRTDIEWADMTWNPVTGCYHGCEYCYARGIARRFKAKGIEPADGMRAAWLGSPFRNSEGKIEPYPFGFMPTFHAYRLDEPTKIKAGQNIFVCSMADLFGAWVPDDWIRAVVDVCRRTPQHRFMFLTKNPSRYDELIDKGIIGPADDNLWLGSTITDLSKKAHWNTAMHTFWSCEPLLAPWPPAVSGRGMPEKCPEWVILGAETGNRKGKVVPQKEWVDNIVAKCRMMGTKVFMKDSLIPIVGEQNMIREIPSGLWREE